MENEGKLRHVRHRWTSSTHHAGMHIMIMSSSSFSRRHCKQSFWSKTGHCRPERSVDDQVVQHQQGRSCDCDAAMYLQVISETQMFDIMVSHKFSDFRNDAQAGDDHRKSRP